MGGYKSGAVFEDWLLHADICAERWIDCSAQRHNVMTNKITGLGPEIRAQFRGYTFPLFTATPDLGEALCEHHFGGLCETEKWREKMQRAD